MYSIWFLVKKREREVFVWNTAAQVSERHRIDEIEPPVAQSHPLRLFLHYLLSDSSTNFFW